MPIEAEIEGIGILEFPDGTSNEVIQSAAKRIIAQRAAAKPATIPQVEAAAVVGSTAQLNQAVQKSATIGEMRRREEQGLVSSLSPEQIRQATMSDAARMGEAMQQEEARLTAAGAPSMFEEKAPEPSTVLPLAGRVAPALVAAPFTGGMSIPAMMGVGALSSAIGEAVGQSLEKLLGQRQEYSAREMAAAGAMGAAPILRGGGVLKPTANIVMQGAGGVAGEAVRTGEFRPEAGLLPAAFTAGFQIPGAVAGRTGAGFERAAERASTVERIGEGVQPTFGQAMPRFAGLESRIESRAGMRPITEQLAQQGEQIKTAVQRLTGVAAEGADTITKKLLGALNANEIDDIANASANLKNAEAILDSARGEAQKQAQQRAVDQARKEYQNTIRNTLFKGQDVSAFRIVPAGQQIESIADQSKSAIKAEANRLYGKANELENVAAFDLFSAPSGQQSFASQANDLLSRIPDIPAGGLTEAKKILSRRQTVPAPPSSDPTAPLTISVPQKATLKELKGIRDELYDFADYAGEAIGNNAQREVRNLAKKLSDTISTQAPSSLGQEAASSIVAGDEFYAAARPKLNLFGVRRAFVPETMERGQLGQALVSGVKTQGLLAPEFANLEDLIKTLKSRIPQKISRAETGEDLVSATIQPYKGGEVFEGPMHAIAYEKMSAKYPNIDPESTIAGFKTTKGRVVSRYEAARIKDFKKRGLESEDVSFAESPENIVKIPDLEEVYSSIRSGIVSDATDAATGAIDYKKLAGTINNIETQSPGALQKIGFGTSEQLSKFVDFLQSTGQKQGPQALLDVLNTKTPAGFALASEAVQILPNVKDVGSVVRYLEREAVAGNKLAKEALISTRAKQIEDLLLAETAAGTGPKLEPMSKIKRAEQILGPTLYKQIVDDIIPGYKTILNAQRAAGGGGGLVVGQAAEEFVSGIPQAALKTAAGKPVEGFMGLMADAVNAGFYSVAAKALARASGSAGYRSAAETARIMEKFSNLPRASVYDALSKYGETGELPK